MLMKQNVNSDVRNDLPIDNTLAEREFGSSVLKYLDIPSIVRSDERLFQRSTFFKLVINKNLKQSKILIYMLKLLMG